MQEGDFSSEPECFAHVVSDEDGSLAQAVAQFQELVLQLYPRYGIESAKRFVEKQKLRFSRQGPRNPHALALAARKLAWITIEKLRRLKAYLMKQFGDTGSDPFGRPTVQSRHQADVFADGEMREKPDLLNDVSDAAPQLNEIPLGGGTVFDQHVAGGRKQQAVEHFERGGLSRAAAAEQDERTANFNAKIQIAKDGITAYVVRDVAEFQDCAQRIAQRFSAKGQSRSIH